MNFLAHLYLAEKTSDSIIGTMLADFVKNDFQNHYNKKICRAIIEHRAVDKFTDAHPVFLRSIKRINDNFRLLKGIMIDIFYDHYLAKNWSSFSDISLEKFCDDVYGIFLKYQNTFPPEMQPIIPRMIRENWLISYRDINGIDDVLKRLTNRLSKKNNLGYGITALKENYNNFESDFQEFFPDLIKYVRKFQTNNSFFK